MQGKPQKNVPTGIKYYAVFYLWNDTIHAIPFDSKEEAEREGAKWIETVKRKVAKRGKPEGVKPDDYVKNFYVSKRNMDKYKNGEVF